MDTIRYVLGLFLVIGLPPGLSWWFLVHPFVGFWRRRGAAVTVGAMTVFFVVTLSGLAAVRRIIIGPDLGTNPLLVAVGAVLIAAGVYIAILRKKHLTARILMGIPEVHEDGAKRGRLLDQGPYAVIRHPRYVEISLFTLGYAAVSNHVGPYVVALFTFPLIHLIVLLEERELRDRFGDAYSAYAARVPRYVPRRWSERAVNRRSS